MTSLVETSLAAFLEAQLASLEPLPFVRPAATREEKPVGKGLVIVQCTSVPHKVGGLYEGNVSVWVQTPFVTGYTVAMHQALVTAVDFAFNPVVDDDHNQDAVDAIKAALGDEIEDQAGYHFGGLWWDGPRDQHTKDNWITVCDIRLGLRKL